MYQETDYYALKLLSRKRRADNGAIAVSNKKTALENMGFTVTVVHPTELNFLFKNHVIKYWPYSGWFSGKTVKDGRGFKTLMSQLLKESISG